MSLLPHLRNLLIGTAVAAAGFLRVDLQAEEPALKAPLTRESAWKTVFAEEEVKIELKSAVDPPVKGRLLWSLSSSEGLSLFKGEIPADGTELFESRLKFPSVKPGVVFSTLLTARLYREGEREPAASYEAPIHVYPRDPFHERRETLKNLSIKLYDPAGNTAKVLTAVEFPYEQITNVAAISEVNDGLLLIGEGVSFRDDRSLAELLVQAATRGTPVLCLTPSAGEFELPEPGDKSAVVGLSLQKNGFIRHLDKRFDDLQWLSHPVMARHSLKAGGRGTNITMEVAAGNDGWPWLEMQFAKKPGDTKVATEPTKMIVMSLPVIEHWEAGPTPRFLFSKLVDYVTPTPLPVPAKADVAP
jgi:hypothetical protein